MRRRPSRSVSLAATRTIGWRPSDCATRSSWRSWAATARLSTMRAGWSATASTRSSTTSSCRRRRGPTAADRVVGVYRVMRDDQARAGQGASIPRTSTTWPRSGRAAAACSSSGGRACTATIAAARRCSTSGTGWPTTSGQHGIEVLFGVASFHGTDPQALAEPLSLLHHRHLAPPDLRVRSRVPASRWTCCPRTGSTGAGRWSRCRPSSRRISGSAASWARGRSSTARSTPPTSA